LLHLKRVKNYKLDEHNWVVGSLNGLSADLGGCRHLVRLITDNGTCPHADIAVDENILNKMSWMLVIDAR
jgi:hypothetical protein